AWLSRDLVDRLDQAVRHFRLITAGDYTDTIEITRDDEIGRVMQAIKSMQIRLGFEVQQQRRINEASTRIRNALDSADSSILVANQDLVVAHANRSARSLLDDAADGIRQRLPEFDAQQLVGSDIALLLQGPDEPRAQLLELQEASTRRL